jgi:hypothetical protein
VRDVKISECCWRCRCRTPTRLRSCNTPVSLGIELIALGSARTTLLPPSLRVQPISCFNVVPYLFALVFVPSRALGVPRLPCVRARFGERVNVVVIFVSPQSHDWFARLGLTLHLKRCMGGLKDGHTTPSSLVPLFRSSLPGIKRHAMLRSPSSGANTASSETPCPS